jgi:hypothetical protein
MLPTRQPSLSKSTFLMGRQCSKLLWFRYNAKDQIPAPDEAQQAVFDQGTEVGELAQQLFPGGMVVAPGIITPQEVIAQTQDASRDIEEQIDAMQRVIGAKAHPEIQIGPQCDNPYTCALHDRCWSFLPEASVFTLYRGGQKGFSLLKRGIQKLADIPANVELTDNQAIQRSTLLAGQPHIDRSALAAFLGQLEYPISYLDFETIGTAIPLFDGVSPYQQVPFQYSLHIVHQPGADPEHHSFLADGKEDPRSKFMQNLREILPATGSVVAYNAGFETGRLKECCELLPEHKPWLRKVTPRIVDLLLPFRGFRYHHPDQNGSNSMKAVLPALTGKGYEKLAIQEGGAASREFLRVTFGDVTAAERRRVRRDLEEYCGLDTLGMVQIVDQLNRLTTKQPT